MGIKSSRRVVNLRESLSTQRLLNEIGPDFPGLSWSDATRYVTRSVGHRVGRASPRQNRHNPRDGLVGSSPRLLQGLGEPRPDAARSGPVDAQPRVEVEAHRGPPPVWSPDRLRANPAQLLEALERALHDPGLRQPGPLLAVHLARGELARQLAVSEPGCEQGVR